MTHLTLAARSRQGTGRLADRLFRGSSQFAALMLVVLLIAIGALLFANSRLTWETFGLSFITGMDWDPVAGIYGAMPFIVGTILASLLAIVIAAPIGILTSLYLSELAPRRTATPLTFMIELLAAIPSVVIGLWGVFILAPFLKTTVEAWIVSTFGWIPFLGGPTYGIGLFSAGVILSIMILPTIVTISREVIQAVPGSQREAMFALGATRWEVIRRAVVPFARSPASSARSSSGSAGHSARRWRSRWSSATATRSRRPCSTRHRRSPRRSRRRSTRPRSASRRPASSRWA